MTKETFYSILRHLMSAAGAILIGKHLLGTTVSEQLLSDTTGVLIALISTIWSFRDKTSTYEAFEGAIRQIITFIGGLAFASGSQAWQTISGIAVMVLPWIYAQITKSKNVALKSGDLPVKDLKTNKSAA